MDVVISVLLLAGLVTYGSAEDNSNKENNFDRPLEGSIGTPVLRKKRSTEDLYGSETEQNPDDPKYKALIEEVVYSHVGFSKKNTKKITVAKLTTQVSGITIKSKFLVELDNGKTMECSSEVSEKLGLQAKTVSYQCKEGDDDMKHIGVAKESVGSYLKNLPDQPNVADMSIRNYTIREIGVSRQKILYINVDVTNLHFNGLKTIIRCSVLFELPGDAVPFSLNCFEDPPETYNGAEMWGNPSSNFYYDLVEKSVLNKPIELQGDIKQYDIIVTFAKNKFSWDRYTIDFIARLAKDGRQYKCKSVIWKKPAGNHIERINCETTPPNQLKLSKRPKPKPSKLRKLSKLRKPSKLRRPIPQKW